jgi:hypothetical protein
MHEISTRFSEISPNFGDEICCDTGISRKWMNEISTKFCEILVGNEIFDEISRKEMNKISRNFCFEIFTKFREIKFTFALISFFAK